MTLDFTEEGKVKIKMLNYVEKMITSLSKERDGEASTPAANHLFDVDEDSPLVDQKRAQLFHIYVAKTLFLRKPARPDLQIAAAFLTTRVKGLNEDKYKKLIRMMQFIQATKDDCLTLSANSLHTVRWWVDASYSYRTSRHEESHGQLYVTRNRRSIWNFKET